MSGYLQWDTDDTPAGRILAILTRAGNAYHNTEQWQDDDYGDGSYVDQIEEVVRQECRQLDMTCRQLDAANRRSRAEVERLREELDTLKAEQKKGGEE